MSQKNKTPEKIANKPPEENQKKKAHTAPSRTPKSPSTASPKKSANIFMGVVLLLIAGGFYVHQKGYITQYYPLVKSQLAPDDALQKMINAPQDEETTPPLDSPSLNEEAHEEAEINPLEPVEPMEQKETAPLVSVSDKFPEISLLQDRVQRLEARVSELSKSLIPLREESVPEEVGQDNLAPLKLFSAFQELTYKVQQGFPFEEELVNLKEHFSPEDFQSLSTFAKIGVPTLPYLTQHFKKIARLLDQEEAFQSATTLLEKSKVLLGQLIHVEKIDDSTSPQHSGTGLYKTQLRQGNVAAVIKGIERLNPTDKTTGESVALWITHGKAYDTAQVILTKTKKTILGS